MARKKYDITHWDDKLSLNENAKKLNIDKNYCRVLAHRKKLSFKKVNNPK